MAISPIPATSIRNKHPSELRLDSATCFMFSDIFPAPDRVYAARSPARAFRPPAPRKAAMNITSMPIQVKALPYCVTVRQRRSRPIKPTTPVRIASLRITVRRKRRINSAYPCSFIRGYSLGIASDIHFLHLTTMEKLKRKPFPVLRQARLGRPAIACHAQAAESEDHRLPGAACRCGMDAISCVAAYIAQVGADRTDEVLIGVLRLAHITGHDRHDRWTE